MKFRFIKVAGFNEPASNWRYILEVKRHLWSDWEVILNENDDAPGIFNDEEIEKIAKILKKVYIW